MNIAFIGPGIMPIPPDTWGAVEMMIWDYSNILCKNGIEVDIINTPNREEILIKVKFILSSFCIIIFSTHIYYLIYLI